MPERGKQVAKDSRSNTLADNRRAGRLYSILDRFEAGIVLTGAEVKSCRNGKVQLSDAYATVKNNELWLQNVHISAYSHARIEREEPVRPRKLLMHRREIDRIAGKVRQKGLTLIPTRVYTKDGRIKCEIALAKGKQVHDKRDAKRKALEEAEAREAAQRRSKRR